MESLISPKIAGNTLLSLFGLFFALHVLIMLGVVPHGFVWGGRITSRAQLIRLETVALLLLGLMALVVSIRMGYLAANLHPTFLKIGIWALFAFFILNTLGNFMAKNSKEK